MYHNHVRHTNNFTLSRVTEGTGPVKSGNLRVCKVLIPAVYPTDEALNKALACEGFFCWKSLS